MSIDEPGIDSRPARLSEGRWLGVLVHIILGILGGVLGGWVFGFLGIWQGRSHVWVHGCGFCQRGDFGLDFPLTEKDPTEEAIRRLLNHWLRVIWASGWTFSIFSKSKRRKSVVAFGDPLGAGQLQPSRSTVTFSRRLSR